MDGCKQMDGGGYFMGVRLMYAQFTELVDMLENG